jgi:xylan 1,4-beta-xylosidase
MVRFGKKIRNVFAYLAVSILVVPIAQTVSGATFTVSVDASNDKGVLRHFWEEAIGTGEAFQLDLPGHREHLRMAREELGMKRTIHHGLTHDDMQIYNEDNAGKVSYTWAKFDTVYDYAIKTLGMRPHFSFFPMPAKLAVDPTITCMVPKFIHSKPKNWEKWRDLCRAIAQHVVDRYGVAVARECYFRVWNENNEGGFTIGFSAEKDDEYFHLYDYAVEGVRSVDSLLRVGGPSYSGGDVALAGKFLDHCLTANYAAPSKKSTPVDFLSLTFYSSGQNTKSYGTLKGISQKTGDMHKLLAGKNLEDKIEFHWTEYGGSWARNSIYGGDTYDKHDGLINAAHTAYQVGSLLYDWNNCGYGGVNSPAVPEVFSYWVLSDYFNEDGIYDKDFINTHGMITRRSSIKKPIWNAYKALHMLGDRILPMTHSSSASNDKGIASFDAKTKQVGVMLYDCPEDVTVFTENQVQLSVSNLPTLWGKTDSLFFRRYLIDREHSNAHAIWQLLKKPEPMNAEEVAKCKAGQELTVVDSGAIPLPANGTYSTTITQPGQSVTLITLQPFRNGTQVKEIMVQPTGLRLLKGVIVSRFMLNDGMVPVALRGRVSRIELFEITGRKIFSGDVDQSGRILGIRSAADLPRQVYVAKFRRGE